MKRAIARSGAAVALLAVSAAAAPTQTKLDVSDPRTSANVGSSIGVDGDLAVIGADGDSQLGVRAGAAYVFGRSGGTWSQQLKLVAPDAVQGQVSPEDEFGRSVAVHGGTIVVGAPLDNSPGSDAGSAFVFGGAGGQLATSQKLVAPDAEPLDEFGRSVDIDGDTLIVGAPLANSGADVNVGAAYVFVRAGSTWSLQQKLTPPDAASNGSFAAAVAVSGDTALVGAINDSTAGNRTGSVAVFVRSGTTWTFQQRLIASDAAQSDYFGNAVALDGDTAVVGVDLDDTGTLTNAGAAYVFVRSGSAWTQQRKLTAADATQGARLGNSVSVSGDTVVVGAFDEGTAGDHVGAAYVFKRSGTSWTQRHKFSGPPAASSGYFGYSVAVSGDTALVGAARADTTTADDDNVGAAFAFEGLAGSSGRSVSYASYLLPKKVVVTTNTKSPSKSKVTISGVIDFGPGAVPGPGTSAILDVGNAKFDIPALASAKNGKILEHSDTGLLLRITLPKAGSSRGSFTLVRTADLAGEVAKDGTLRIAFAGGGISAESTVTVAKGKFTLGKVRGGLIVPSFFPQSAALTLKGPGLDKVSLATGFETAGYDATTVPSVRIGIGGTFTAEIAGQSFTVKGQTFVFKGNVGGITDVKIDLAKERITVSGKGMTLTGLAAAPGPVKFTVTLDSAALGVDERSVDVKLIQAGATLRY